MTRKVESAGRPTATVTSAPPDPIATPLPYSAVMSDNEPVSTRASRPWWRKKRYRFLMVLVLLVGFGYLNNSSLLVATPQEPPLLLAHRGVAQTFDMTDVDGDTCTAEIIDTPTHDLLENTIDSIAAAFDAGADLVEFDVHITADDRFAVFHDWELDCRTDGTGTTRDHTMAQLKQLDIGYGYTADGGATFPFRGEGVGLMPSMEEVLTEFPEQPLLMHIKSDDPREGQVLAERLAHLPDSRLELLTVYGGDAPIEQLRERMPGLRVMSKDIMMSCLLQYELYSWTGIVPEVCRNTQLHVPEGYAPLLWGWPVRFVDRMASVDTRVVLVAGSGDWSEGFDTVESLSRIPEGYTGLIWTNRITDIVGSVR
nr:glycerophosphodiester phosphodiesterase family protein [Stackebrandtia endophytica]